jgi:flagellar basal body rod protein FlgG
MTLTFNTGINYQGDGMFVAARSMAGYLHAVNIHSDNIAFSGIPGYQAKKPVMRRFIEHLGPLAVDSATNEEIGRLRRTGAPNDLALVSEGYFQVMDPNTGDVQTTRDGRIRIGADGQLLTIDGKKAFLDTSGAPLTLPRQPTDLAKQFKVTEDGSVLYYNPYGGDMIPVGRFSVVSAQGDPAKEVKVSQGFSEDSNVMLAQEFAGLLPKRREFEANRQAFILQSDSLAKMIQELGRAQ